MKTNLISILFLFFISNASLAINKDSLIAVTQATIPDSAKLVNLIVLVKCAESEDEFYLYLNKGLFLADKLNDSKSRTDLKVKEGKHFFDLQEDDKGMQVLLDEITLAEKKKDSLSISRINYSIGSYYFYKQDIDNSIKYMTASVVTYPTSENQLVKATSLMALGVVLQNTPRLEESIRYQKQALKIKEDANAYQQLPVSLNNLAELHYQLGQKEEAYRLLDRSIELCDSIGQPTSYFYAIFVKGEIYVKEKRFKEAIPLIETAVDFWEETKSWRDLTRAYQQLSAAYLGANLPYDAMKAMNNYVVMKDSIFNMDQRSGANEIAAKYETEKRELQLQQEKEAKEFAQKEKVLNEDAEKMRSIVFAIIGFILIINIIYFYKRYKAQQKDKELIAEQKQQLEVRSQEIMDSIIYAKRIQAAILPRDTKVKKLLPDSFILYKPKDVVAGDFYWLEEVNDGILFAAADCTGHGVPGAMVSVVCNNGLNRAVLQMGLTNPAEILNTTREIIVDEFNKAEGELKDGMDIALCKLQNNKLFFAGAHNPVWIIRKSSNTGLQEVIEIKGDKQPVGKFEKEFPFTSKEIELEKNDLIYIFTDGIFDQFGGSKGKKLKAANFKKLLLSLSNFPMQKQLAEIEKAFDNWKGELEQLDDVCVIGVKI